MQWAMGVPVRRAQGTFLRRNGGRVKCDLKIGNCDTANSVDAGGPKRKFSGRLDQGDSLMLDLWLLVSVKSL